MFQVSAKTEYGCLAMLELAASHGQGQATRVRDIAEQHGIPSGFLVQILLQLKSAGLVRSTRGASGGYWLARSPSDVSLAEIVQALEGQPQEPPNHAKQQTAAAQVLGEVWSELAESERAWLAATTLSDLLERLPARAVDMYYI